MQTYILFFPRIGRNRELKKVLEGYWKGELSEGQLRNTVDELIDRIEVSEATVVDGKRHQNIKIFYRFVGAV